MRWEGQLHVGESPTRSGRSSWPRVHSHDVDEHVIHHIIAAAALDLKLTCTEFMEADAWMY